MLRREMRWYLWLGLAAIVVVCFGVYRYSRLSTGLAFPQGAEELAKVRARTDAQDEEAFYRPARQSAQYSTANPLNNVYFGDLHVHTTESMDAYLFGNRIDMDTAYRVAMGESADIGTGERVVLNRPLDFAALTDHAEGFGRALACARPELSKAVRKACDATPTPTARWPSSASSNSVRARATSSPLRCKRA